VTVAEAVVFAAAAAVAVAVAVVDRHHRFGWKTNSDFPGLRSPTADY